MRVGEGASEQVVAAAGEKQGIRDAGDAEGQERVDHSSALSCNLDGQKVIDTLSNPHLKEGGDDGGQTKFDYAINTALAKVRGILEKYYLHDD